MARPDETIDSFIRCMSVMEDYEYLLERIERIRDELTEEASIN